MLQIMILNGSETHRSKICKFAVICGQLTSMFDAPGCFLFVLDLGRLRTRFCPGIPPSLSPEKMRRWWQAETVADVQYAVLMGPRLRCFKIYTLKIHLNFSVQNRLNKTNKSGGSNVILCQVQQTLREMTVYVCWLLPFQSTPWSSGSLP